MSNESTARTYVIAPTLLQASALARVNGLSPHSRDVVLVSRGKQLYGHSLTADDRVIWAEAAASWSTGQLEDLVENLEIAQAEMTMAEVHGSHAGG